MEYNIILRVCILVRNDNDHDCVLQQDCSMLVYSDSRSPAAASTETEVDWISKITNNG